MPWWSKVEEIYYDLPRIANHLVFGIIFSKFFQHKLGFVRRLRQVASFCMVAEVIFVSLGFLLWSSKLVNSAGLCFDIVGALILFLREEWERLLEPYSDTEKYPYGPPSYVTRDWFAFESPDAFLYFDDESGETSPDMTQYYYWQRGIFLLVLGFALQFIALWM
ncbi:hypothetical protein WOC76_12610 [Methylocystis sp. IM3]|uniref:hypothetical protein n=1 Tax=unclassified Methylocystis TaxID=2625913 RepID=UPI0030FC3B5F